MSSENPGCGKASNLRVKNWWGGVIAYQNARRADEAAGAPVKSYGTEGGDKDDSYKQDNDGRMTNNLDEYGVINLQLVQEILDLTCIMGELPVVYELNKRKLSLSKTLGKLFSVCCQDPERRWHAWVVQDFEDNGELCMISGTCSYNPNNQWGCWFTSIVFQY